MRDELSLTGLGTVTQHQTVALFILSDTVMDSRNVPQYQWLGKQYGQFTLTKTVGTRLISSLITNPP